MPVVCGSQMSASRASGMDANTRPTTASKNNALSATYPPPPPRPARARSSRIQPPPRRTKAPDPPIPAPIHNLARPLAVRPRSPFRSPSSSLLSPLCARLEFDPYLMRPTNSALRCPRSEPATGIRSGRCSRRFRGDPARVSRDGVHAKPEACRRC